MNRDATCLALTGTSILYVGSYSSNLFCTFAIVNNLKSFYYYHFFLLFLAIILLLYLESSQFITF